MSGSQHVDANSPNAHLHVRVPVNVTKYTILTTIAAIEKTTKIAPIIFELAQSAQTRTTMIASPRMSTLEDEKTGQQTNIQQ